MSQRRLLSAAAACLALAVAAGAWAQGASTGAPTIPGTPPVPPTVKSADQAPEEQPPTSQPVTGPAAAGQATPAQGAADQAAAGAQGATPPVEGAASPVTPLPPLPPQPVAPRTFEDMKIAVLGGLDKVTGRVSTVEIPVGQSGRFGQLTVAARACRKTTPIEEPESAAFLDIVEAKPDDPAAKVFTGWMFASSPALSAMEDPVYDVWVVDCKNPATKAASPKPQ
ncbi:DUF2155 domain-containing protein [Nitrospirillum iridis]|uniref:DUF2155 domain-containing protein n=1 Tax=Nitrospirillum iridis TaxID=765888 RepID=A0A7X0EGC4_9PROT|nr:DUF2155 domain-containing protein [Nitrospirillum iridis]MBB6254835.1 hypothetical protein [Nitrospirillum iridis]